MRLLVAEDDIYLSKALTAILERSNYSVDTVYNGNDALSYGASGNYDGIILDIMMPGKDGIKVLSELRREGISTPVMLLTAKSELEDRITGFDSGADDYLPKPFAMRELLSRVRAMLRRKTDFSPDLLTFADLTLNRSSYELMCGGQFVRLGNKEFQVMEMLMANMRQVISTTQLMERIWGWDSESEINVVWVCISSLRKKLSELGVRAEIRAIRGVGYSLEERR